MVPERRSMALLAQAMRARLHSRRADLVYQNAAVKLEEFPTSLTSKIFPPALQTRDAPGLKTWRAESMAAVESMIGTLFTDAYPATMAGPARALISPSEQYVRKIALVIPPLEISSVPRPTGDVLYINFLFAMVDEQGSIEWPKDEERREMLFSASEVASVRSSSFEALQTMAAARMPLSEGFWTQLGNRAMAAATARGGDGRLAAAPAKRRRAAPAWDVEAILAERQTASGAAEYEVLWDMAGYEPWWERYRTVGAAGTPLTTWEPLKNVKMTLAYEQWRADHGG